MTTAYALLLDRCGLSHREAALFVHQVRPDTVKAWAAGRNRVPAGAIAELRALYARIEAAAVQALDQIEAMAADGAPDRIELGLACDDAEAQALGWPCVGAQAAMLGLVVACMAGDAMIVPRGATVPGAAAADAHERGLG